MVVVFQSLWSTFWMEKSSLYFTSWWRRLSFLTKFTLTVSSCNETSFQRICISLKKKHQKIYKNKNCLAHFISRRSCFMTKTLLRHKISTFNTFSLSSIFYNEYSACSYLNLIDNYLKRHFNILFYRLFLFTLICIFHHLIIRHGTVSNLKMDQFMNYKKN